jgi:hypothetical protein
MKWTMGKTGKVCSKLAVAYIDFANSQWWMACSPIVCKAAFQVYVKRG